MRLTYYVEPMPDWARYPSPFSPPSHHRWAVTTLSEGSNPDLLFSAITKPEAMAWAKLRAAEDLAAGETVEIRPKDQRGRFQERGEITLPRSSDPQRSPG